VSGRILIVDDAAENLRVLHDLLKAEGYTVLTAMRGEVALSAATGPQTPDMVLLDVRMPGMDGYEICRRLKADAATRDIPVMFLSAGGDMADKVEGFRVGGVDYVTKPFQVEEVLARVATHLAISRQRREIAALSALKDQLIRTISHDLKNPLTIVLGNAEYLLSSKAPLTDEDRRRLIEGVQRRGQEMLGLVTDLLDLSRIEEGMPLHLEPLDLGALAERQAKDALDRGHGIDLRYESPAETVTVKADGERLAQVAANLLSNALKYTPTGGRVTVSVERVAGCGVLRVRDTGLGIPADALRRVFEPFYRVDQPEHRKAEGTGLGLSIVKAIVEQHGGEVRVESEPGTGSTFTVLLPLAPG
jgi:two-component system, sensor histidine kinase and response regulator